MYLSLSHMAERITTHDTDNGDKLKFVRAADEKLIINVLGAN